MDAYDLNPKDLINLRKTTQELFHRKITKTHSNVKKLQQSLDKSENLLKLEKVATAAREARIRDLESKIMHLGMFPKDVKTTKAVMDQKDQ